MTTVIGLGAHVTYAGSPIYCCRFYTSTPLLLQFSQIHFGQVHYRFGHIFHMLAAIATSTLLFSCLCSSIVEKQCLYSRSIGNQLREGGSDPAELIIETEHRD